MQLEEQQKNTIKSLFSEWQSTETEKKELSKKLKDKLKSDNEKYQELLDEKKALDQKLKDIEQSDTDYLAIKNCDEDIKSNKSDLKDNLAIKGDQLTTLFKQYKKADDGVDFLDPINEAWVHVFVD